MKRRPSRGARAVVTGAGSGIGRAFALELHARGGAVVCSDVDLAAARRVADEITARGGRATAVACDVASSDAVDALAASANDWFGAPADLIVNNAGVGLGGRRVEDISLDDWRWIMGINLWGVIHGCRAFVPGMRALGEGGVINVASAASFGSAPMMGAYNTTKAGVVALSETLAAELSGSGVHVSVLCPTFVKTNIIRSSRLDGASQTAGQRMMDRIGMAPERVAAITLDGLDDGRLHLLPQRDAQFSWWLKRTAPGTYTRGMGVLSRFMPK